MSFANPLGLWVLLGAVPLLAAYFLRRRQEPRKVSALFLWRAITPAAAAGPRFERFRRERSLLLELLALACAALFLANLRCGSEGPRGHLVLVLDGSLSMNARGADGKTPFDRARQAAREEIARTGAGRVTVLEAGPTPRLLAGPEADAEDALAVLDAHRPAGPDAPPSLSLQMGQELAGAGRPFAFLTDAPPAENFPVPETLRWIALGEARDNLGFVSAQRRDLGGNARIAVRVASFQQDEADVTVRFTPERGEPRTEQVKLAGGKTQTFTVELENPGGVEVKLVGTDALAEDDRIRLLPSPERTAEVAIVEGLEPSARTALTRVLGILPSARLLGADATPEQLARALTIGPRSSTATATIDAVGTQRTFIGPFFTEKAHPLLEDVRLDGVAWTAGENPPGRPLVRAGDAVLLSEELATGGSRFHLNVQLSRSNLQRTAAWPILIGNLLRASATRSPGFARKQLSLGEEVSVTTESGASWVVQGASVRRPLLGVGTLLLAPLPVGRYALLKDGEQVDELEVLALDPAESELRQRATSTREPTRTAELLSSSEGGPSAPAWPLILLLGAALTNFAFTRRTG